MTTVPSFLAHLPMQGALLVPWFVFKDPTGRYHFRVRDPQRHMDAVRFGLCGICGKYTGGPPFLFQVGPLCLVERGVYGSPSHEQCALAALQLCPYLAQQDWKRGEDRGLLVPADRQIVPHDELPPKPARMGLALCDSYRAVPANRTWYAYFSEPKSIRWWVYQDGKLVPEPQPQETP